MAIDRELLEILACPVCKGDIELREKRRIWVCSNEECRIHHPVFDSVPERCPRCGSEVRVIEGDYLECVECGRWYPIIDEIPHMLPDELRDDLLDEDRARFRK